MNDRIICSNESCLASQESDEQSFDPVNRLTADLVGANTYSFSFIPFSLPISGTSFQITIT
uniref:Uncharacterized protein n=1 Tax=Parascaris equorum TaxID=6256 RepID=A0A914RAW1_PAREQ